MECGETRIARLAQHHAEPIVEDLIPAAQMPHVADVYREPVAGTGEDMVTLFVRLMIEFTKWMPMLCRPTVFDLGEARIVVLDLEEVCLKSSWQDTMQTRIMYMVARKILAGDFFLRPAHARYSPARYRAYSLAKFRDMRQATKRFCYDEFHRTEGCEQIIDQAVLDQREGRKLKVRMGLSSQRLADFPPKLAELATSIYICGLGKEETVEDAMQRFGLRESSRYVLQSRLFGPEQRHGANPVFGAPFLASWTLDNRIGRVEQMLYNMLGPTELWALTTRPDDVDLRDRLYDALGHQETWRRLAVVFPTGSAAEEIDRRTHALTRLGRERSEAERAVIRDIAIEVIDGVGVGIALRPSSGIVSGAELEEAHRRKHRDWLADIRN